MKSLDYYKEIKPELLKKDDMENFDAKNMMMTVKYWPDGPGEESGEPRFIQDVTSIKRDPRTGEFVIGTVFTEKSKLIEIVGDTSWIKTCISDYGNNRRKYTA